MNLRSFPLQNKKIQKCVSPLLRIGTCEVMNASQNFFLDSFFVCNSQNHQLFLQQQENDSPISSCTEILENKCSNLFGNFIGAGMMDSPTNRGTSAFISQYLTKALSLHTRVPQEMKELKKKFPADPLVDVMLYGLSLRNLMQPRGRFCSPSTSTMPNRTFSAHQESTKLPPLSVIDGWDMEQYALCADAALLQHFCPKQNSCSSSVRPCSFSHSDASLSGCSGVWFTAVAVPCASFALGEGRKTIKNERRTVEQLYNPSLMLDVCVSGVGNSRAFGLKKGRGQKFLESKNPNTVVSPLAYDLRNVLIPLSMDHLPAREEELRRIVFAGGAVENEKLIVGKESSTSMPESSFHSSSRSLPLSRSFGYFLCKKNQHRSPKQQVLIAVPTTKTWTMSEGDALVLCNHAVFESRMNDNTTVDEVAKLVAYELDQNRSPEDVAGAVCDYAIRFGAEKALQVTVAVATTDSGDKCKPPLSLTPQLTEWVSPGSLYVEVCRHDVAYAEALLRDCKRCGISLPELLWKRWEKIHQVLPLRHSLPLASMYGKECGALQQRMDEEALLFSHPVLERVGTSKCGKEILMPVFASLAKQLLPEKLKVLL